MRGAVIRGEEDAKPALKRITNVIEPQRLMSALGRRTPTAGSLTSVAQPFWICWSLTVTPVPLSRWYEQKMSCDSGFPLCSSESIRPVAPGSHSKRGKSRYLPSCSRRFPCHRMIRVVLRLDYLDRKGRSDGHRGDILIKD
jgi:hypothetical protein